jgi:hypothetical protein
VHIRSTPPTTHDREAFEVIKRFALTEEEDEALALARKVNARVARRISAPYGIPLESAARRDIQRRLRAWFEDMQAGRAASLPVGAGIDGFILRYQRPAPRARAVMTYEWNCTGLGRFWMDVAALMVRVGPSLRQCETCQQIFVRSKRQTYCTTRCSQIARSARWYEAHRDTILRTRQRAYVNKVRQRFPRARIRQRAVHPVH